MNLLDYREKLGRPLIMGHRGAPGGSLDNTGHKVGYAPENTMASFQLAKEMGVDAIELDVHLSADGHLIVIHDETVDRTTDGTGAIEALTLEAIKKLDAGSHFDARFKGEAVPTLEEVLSWAKGQLPVVIEMKPTRKIEAVIEAAIALVERMGMGDEVAFISFDHHIPLGIKKRQRHWMTGALYVGRVVDPVGLAGAAQVNGLLPHFGFLTPDLIEQAHAERLWVGCWCPNTEAELQHAIAAGADMIGTNYPDRLKKLLGMA